MIRGRSLILQTFGIFTRCERSLVTLAWLGKVLAALSTDLYYIDRELHLIVVSRLSQPPEARPDHHVGKTGVSGASQELQRHVLPS